MTSWPASRRLADIAIRLLYLGAALAMTWVLALRNRAIQEAYGSTFEFPLGRWLLAVGAGVLLGVLVGLALRPVTWGRGYRWGVALALGLPPALLLATVPAYLQTTWVPPSWVLTVTSSGGHAVLSVMVGLAIVGGFTSREAAPPEDGPPGGGG